jgi:hypothetical protein
VKQFLSLSKSTTTLNFALNFSLNLIGTLFKIPRLKLGVIMSSAVSANSGTIAVTWTQGLPQIETARLHLRPVRAEDLSTYKELFESRTVMAQYMGGPRDITSRFETWVKRWTVHSFSALAVVDKKMQKAIGHVISGHGDYEGNRNTNGWSEMAFILHPAYWNSDFKDGEKGAAGERGIGKEVVEASVAYARSLQMRAIEVPSDVTAEQRPEVEKWAVEDKNLSVHRNEQGEIDWVYLPYTELRATAHKDNIASTKILKHVFVEENKGVVKPAANDRNLFTISI